MKKESDESGKRTELRKRAEARLESESIDIPNMKPDEVQNLIHELRTHQIELEIQNEELRRSQEELIEMRYKYSDLYDFAPVGYMTVSRTGLILDANLTLADMLRVERRALLKQPLSSFILPIDEDIFYHHRREILESKYRGTCSLRMICRGADPLWVEMDSIPIEADDERDTGLRISVIDITDRKHIEEELQENELKYRVLFNSNAFLMYLADNKGTIILSNNKGADFFGQSPETIMGKSFFELRQDRAQMCQDVLNKVLSTDDIYQFETLYPTPDEDKWLNVTVSPIKIDDNTLLQIISQDITDRKQTEEALKESEKKFRTLFENAGDPIFIRNFKGQFLEVNQIACDRYGYSREDLLQMTSMDMDTPEHAEKLPDRTKEIIQRGHYIFESVHVCKDGKLIPVELSTRLITYNQRPAIMTSASDLTERKYLEAQIHQILKMEAVGTLAGGIAHDFNNLLMGILGNASILLAEIDQSHPHYEILTEIEGYVKNAASLTKQLLGFARGGKYEVKPTDLNELLKTHNHMFGRTRKEITIKDKYEDKLWVTEVDANQMEQVLLNIYVNAWQAMPEGGEIYVQTEKHKA